VTLAGIPLEVHRGLLDRLPWWAAFAKEAGV
jgi:hypothetical protein